MTTEREGWASEAEYQECKREYERDAMADALSDSDIREAGEFKYGPVCAPESNAHTGARAGSRASIKAA